MSNTRAGLHPDALQQRSSAAKTRRSVHQQLVCTSSNTLLCCSDCFFLSRSSLCRFPNPSSLIIPSIIEVSNLHINMDSLSSLQLQSHHHSYTKTLISRTSTTVRTSSTTTEPCIPHPQMLAQAALESEAAMLMILLRPRRPTGATGGLGAGAAGSGCRRFGSPGSQTGSG